jgi:hypothetical protein
MSAPEKLRRGPEGNQPLLTAAAPIPAEGSGIGGTPTGAPQWSARGYRLADLMATLQRIAGNDWDDWTWCRNTRCKYVTLQIDTRDGGYVHIRDRDGNTLTIEDLARQYRGEPR